jgi:hypothetical protein
MKMIKRYLGIVWMIMGPVFLVLLLRGAYHNINAGGDGDISNPVPWIIIITISIPITIGLVIFGWYSFKGEFDEMN